ncbi:MAG: hypothetical protein AAF806_18885 [Bacteroidota bacterium]
MAMEFLWLKEMKLQKDKGRYIESRMMIQYGGRVPFECKKSRREVLSVIEIDGEGANPMDGIEGMKSVFESRLKKYDIINAYLTGFVYEWYDFDKSCWVAKKRDPKKRKYKHLFYVWVAMKKEVQMDREEKGLKRNITFRSKELDVVWEEDMEVAKQLAYKSLIDQLEEVDRNDISKIRIYNQYDTDRKRHCAIINVSDFSVRELQGIFDIDWDSYQTALKDAIEKRKQKLDTISEEEVLQLRHENMVEAVKFSGGHIASVHNPNLYSLWIGLNATQQQLRKERGKPRNITLYSNELERIKEDFSLERAERMAFKSIINQLKLINRDAVKKMYIYNNYAVKSSSSFENHCKTINVHTLAIEENKRFTLPINWDAYKRELAKAKKKAEQ